MAAPTKIGKDDSAGNNSANEVIVQPKVGNDNSAIKSKHRDILHLSQPGCSTILTPMTVDENVSPIEEVCNTFVNNGREYSIIMNDDNSIGKE